MLAGGRSTLMVEVSNYSRLAVSSGDFAKDRKTVHARCNGDLRTVSEQWFLVSPYHPSVWLNDFLGKWAGRGRFEPDRRHFREKYTHDAVRAGNSKNSTHAAAVLQ
jgi:hypothetical protein